MINNKLVVVEDEKEIMVSHLVSYRFFEVGGEVHETSFQSFQVVNMEMVPPVKEPKNVEFLTVSWKDARTVIETRHPKVWGRVSDLLIDKDCSGFGYHSQPSIVKKTMSNVIEGQVLPLPDMFTSIGHLVDGQISMV